MSLQGFDNVNGTQVWAVDANGNTQQSGRVAAEAVVLGMNPSPSTPSIGTVKVYSPDGFNIAVQTPLGDTFTPVAVATTVISTVTIANTVTATPLLAYSIPGNTTRAGTTYRFYAYGVYSTTGTPTLTFTLAIDTALAVIAVTPAITTATVTNAPFVIDATFTARGSGTANLVGNITANLVNNTTTGAVTPVLGAPSTTTSIGTTGAHSYTIYATWGTASASNTISMLGGYVQKVV